MTVIRAARTDDLPAVLGLWGDARSEHAITEDTPERPKALCAVSRSTHSSESWASPDSKRPTIVQ